MVKQWRHHLNGLNQMPINGALKSARESDIVVMKAGIIKMAGECLWAYYAGTWNGPAGEVGSWELPRAEEPLLSIMYRNRQCWAPISELTGPFLHRYRHEISDFMIHHYHNFQ